MWLAYASLCRKDGSTGNAREVALDHAEGILVNLLRCNPARQNIDMPLDQPKVAYAYIKHLWFSNQADLALEYMLQLTSHLSECAIWIHGGYIYLFIYLCFFSLLSFFFKKNIFVSITC